MKDMMDKWENYLFEGKKPGLWDRIHAKRKRGEPPAKPGDEDYPDKKQWDKLTKEVEKDDDPQFQKIPIELWVLEKLVTSVNNLESVSYQDKYDDRYSVDSPEYEDLKDVAWHIEQILEKEVYQEGKYDGLDENDEAVQLEVFLSEEEPLEEAEYQGRKVTLNKPMKGDVKKSKVYVRDPKTGNVKKVNFGDPNMKIKKNNPERRKSFRARHNCDNPGPKTKARYWSCKAW
jgi:hypothetical protein